MCLSSVSIPQWCDCCTLQHALTDSLLNVSIPQWCDCCTLLIPLARKPYDSFNPTMVRLLPATAHGTAHGNGQFQSHNGAIAATVATIKVTQGFLVSIPQWCDCCTATDTATATATAQFQSHNGAIAARGLAQGSRGHRRFNPTMVRLLLFHLTFRQLPFAGFNPTMVRLLREQESDRH